MSPRTNLDVQSKVIARSRAFLGTHGGLSYLPPLYGVKSLSFYSDAGSFSPQHLELARRVFTRMQPGSYVALHVDDLATLRTTLGEQSKRSPESPGGLTLVASGRSSASSAGSRSKADPPVV